jgi:hypothetical protein
MSSHLESKAFLCGTMNCITIEVKAKEHWSFDRICVAALHSSMVAVFPG